ncbi:leucine-rich repeats and immunoglobulin-like domains protein 1 isoform X2 [Hyalella azteca]|uniref:Leucine-rich repeats and immunoglobulin-like domains protein 1 isoform X2 n=1 Tax=Hyalella azteca TaxID=294128 RepID=A0A8B7NL13_HYAAZ|nr:leucine-rich repeats and immunoglobulin-like domains protein 1 isoform X2 [Hyalella azteca]
MECQQDNGHASIHESHVAVAEVRRSPTRQRWRSTRWLVLVALSLVLAHTEAGAKDRNPSYALPVYSQKPRVCPPPKEISPCVCSVISKGLDIVCDHSDESHIRNTLNVLKQKSVAVYWMKFRNCKLARVSDFIFMGLDVIHLNIIRSNVSVIETSSLSALGKSLESLDLASNLLSAVPTTALRSQEMLTFLNLNYNRITSLPEAAFAGMSVLQRLTLYENRIKEIHHNAFKGIPRLTRLNLGKNLLDKIPSDSFHPLVNLEVLDIHENHIVHLPDAAFQGLTKLDMLKLEHNRIEMIQDNVFHDLSLLNSLNIEHNKIVNISDNAFNGLETNLGWLELGNNRLDHIPSHALRPLHSLRQLDLDSNSIQEMQEDAFQGYGDTLKYIILEKNHIKTIPRLAFTDLHSLEWLKIAHNEIKTIPEDTMQPILDTLRMLDLSNNPLVCSCDILWLRHWLLNPHHDSNNVESIGEHICVTPDQKFHVIKTLEEKAFNCPHPRTGGSTRCESCNASSTSDDSSLGEESQPSPWPANEPNEVEIKNPPQKTSGAPALTTMTLVVLCSLLASTLAS